MANPIGLESLIDTVLSAGPVIQRAGEEFPYARAVLWDAYARHEHFLSDEELKVRAASGHAGFLQALACSIVQKLDGKASREGMDRLFLHTLPELARLSKRVRWLSDPEGTEELVRLALRDLDLLPEGETSEAASKRLQAVSILERRHLLEIARQAEQRAREVREALAAQAAREAADKYSRE